jgi:(5-formylfuran-3-yl)methyl phosphate synthase
MMRLLVSVRSAEEALLAARSGADFIDAKEPSRGALGDLPLDSIRDIVEALRDAGLQQAVSATIGDLPLQARAERAERVGAVAACGVDYVKVGIEPGPEAFEALDALSNCGVPVVPVFIADRGIDPELTAQALTLNFAGVMADTADKRAGSLFDAVSRVTLARFVAQARAARVMVGLAGALRLVHAHALAELAPDFAGFRSAVCAGERSAALDALRVRELAAAMRTAQLALARVSPSSSPRMRVSSAR